jgi:alpha-tubulin suppressor-like RCC1 family protein
VAWGAGTFSATTPNFGQCIVPADLTNAIAIAAGGFHSLALTSDGKVVAWSSIDTNLPPTTNAVAIAAGHAAQHSLVLQGDGSVAIGGNTNSFGVLGIQGRTNVVALAGGYDAALALRPDGTVNCWGTNTFPGPWSNVVAVSAGYWGGLVLKADGTVSKWNSWTLPAEVPVPADLTNVVAIAAGGYYQDLVLKADGTVFTWNGTSGTYVPGLSNVVAIAAGDYHNVALKADGTVVAWLINTSEDYGQATVPAGLSNVVAIAAGGFHTLALVGEGPPVLRAPMANPTVGADGLSVSLPSQSGRAYRLEFKNLLTDGAWTPLPLAAGTRDWLTLMDPTATTAQRFYRVRQW